MDLAGLLGKLGCTRPHTKVPWRPRHPRRHIRHQCEPITRLIVSINAFSRTKSTYSLVACPADDEEHFEETQLPPI